MLSPLFLMILFIREAGLHNKISFLGLKLQGILVFQRTMERIDISNFTYFEQFEALKFEVTI